MSIIRQAIKVAETSRHRQRFGAVVAKGSRVISSGINSYKTHTKSTSPYRTTHAEFSAILRSNKELTGATLYVVRLLATGELGLAKPCPDCRRFIEKMNLKKIIYSTEDGFTEESLP